MSFFSTLLILMLAGDFICWRIGNRALRRSGRLRRWRIGWNIFIGLLVGGLMLLLLARLLKLHVRVMPEVAVIALFLWHFILLPITLIITGPWTTGTFAIRRFRKQQAPVNTARREFITRIAILTPPLALVAMTGQSVLSEDDLVLNRIDLPVPNLPPQLEGMTIAHVTDPHLGSFITDRKVQKIIEMTNSLDADLVLQTGDLINSSLDDLPDGIELVRKLRSRYGVYCCEGNHDVIVGDGVQFEADTTRADINMMLDEVRVIRVRGQKIRLVAPRWTGYADGPIENSIRQLVGAPVDDIFTILTTHHPHGFDTAAALNIPLTLAGHTHGGQIALTRNIGIGPLMYRYWSGPYRKQNSTCFVSNGTGNWFPLRINVPCEIVHLTLHRA